MKKLILTGLLLVSLIVAVFGYYKVKADIRCPKGVCHIVYDPVDNFYYCLGSAVNCCCDY